MGGNRLSKLPINTIANNLGNLPVLARDNRLRLQSPEIEERSADRQPNRRDQAEIIQPSDDVQRVVRSASTGEPVFRPIPSFDDLPNNLRDALQTYIATAQSTEPVATDGSELLVGVDTFA
jgi:hypothetical protein